MTLAHAMLLKEQFQLACYTPDEIMNMLRPEDMKTIDSAIESLKEEKDGPRLYLALKKNRGIDCEKKTLQEIGLMFAPSVSAERVRQLSFKASRMVGRDARLNTVAAHLLAQGVTGMYDSQVMKLVSSQVPLDQLAKEIFVQPKVTRHFILDHWPDCNAQKPCPTCQARDQLTDEQWTFLRALAKQWSQGPDELWRHVAVSSFGFSVRTANCLKNNNITSLGQLVECSKWELLRTPNFGQKSLLEIKEKLTELGLELKS